MYLLSADSALYICFDKSPDTSFSPPRFTAVKDVGSFLKAMMAMYPAGYVSTLPH